MSLFSKGAFTTRVWLCDIVTYNKKYTAFVPVLDRVPMENVWLSQVRKVSHISNPPLPSIPAFVNEVTSAKHLRTRARCQGSHLCELSAGSTEDSLDLPLTSIVCAGQAGGQCCGLRRGLQVDSDGTESS